MTSKAVLNSLTGAAFLAASFASAGSDESVVLPAAARTADVVFLGEQHDNAVHHQQQAAWVAELKPSALVFEMLTSDQAARVTPGNRNEATALEAALDWNASGWPDFSMYFPIFEAAPEAVIYGAAVPREKLREIMEVALDEVIGGDTVQMFALDVPLPADEQAARETLQRTAHCDALPENLLPRMVSVQRARDATLAKAALDAFQATGGPVVVITGNGHAREDWGAPYLLRMADPAVDVFSIGQGEAGQIPDGGFGFVADGPAVDRGDPCDVFKQ